MSRFAVLPFALILLFTAVLPVTAATPVHSTTTGTFTLADATSYTAQTTLDVKAKNIRVVVENSGHRPLAK